MGGFEQVDEASLAGARIENADIAAAAAIKPLKIENRPIYIRFPIESGTSTGNGSRGNTDAFPYVQFTDAGDSGIQNNILIPGEISPGSAGVFHIWWASGATSGNVRYVVSFKPIINGTLNLTAGITRNVIGTPDGTTNRLVHSKIDLPPAIFTPGQLVAITIARDAQNSLDTIGSTVSIHSVYLELQGRC